MSFIILRTSLYIYTSSYNLLIGGDFSYEYASALPEFFSLHSMVDAIWDYYQHHYPQHSEKWLNDRKHRIIGYHSPRYWYVDNTNLERCGLKIKYENIFPKKVPLKPNNGRYGGNYAGWEPYYGGYSNFHDQEDKEEREKFYEDSSSGQQEQKPNK